MNKIGCSYYLGNGHVEEDTLAYYANCGCTYVFTSLQIPEEAFCIRDVEHLLEVCHRYQLKLCADVSPIALQRLQVQSIKELYDMGFACLRFDYGFSYEELQQQVGEHQIMINASTITEAELSQLLQQISAKQIIAVHNYYPKPHTGLSMAFVKRQNELLHHFDVETIAFIPGFEKARGPLYRFLPTIEHHRTQPALLSAMELIHLCGCDSIMIGDPLAESLVMKHLQEIVNGTYVFPVVTWYDETYRDLLQTHVVHQRMDESEETIRLQESRVEARYQLHPSQVAYEGDLMIGDIIASNVAYGRYCNEIEVVRIPFAHDPLVNRIGRIDPAYHFLLAYVSGDASIRFI